MCSYAIVDSMEFNSLSNPKVRSPISVIAIDSHSPKSDCTDDFHMVPGETQENVGLSSDSLQVTFAEDDATTPAAPADVSDVSFTHTELYYAQKAQIAQMEQRLQDSEAYLGREIALREHFEEEARYANDASEAFFATTLELSETISKTELQLELKFLAMQHSIALWEAWGTQYGVSIVKASGNETVDVVVAENSCTSG
jgi:hypothetical protein